MQSSTLSQGDAFSSVAGASARSLRIDVYDTGIGIPGEQMPKIFEAFSRLDTVRRDGLGIGLFIVRHAVGLLGHRMDVASNPSRGSRFSICRAALKVWRFRTDRKISD